MQELAQELVTLGSLLLLALGAEALGRHSRVPRISILILLGFLLGPAALDWIDPRGTASFDFISVLALSMVGFLVGGKLSRKLFRSVGSALMTISLWQVAATFAVVAGGLWLLGAGLPLALLLGAIATATDPAATMDAIRTSGKTNKFAKTLTGIVAIDDAWGLIIFSLVLFVLQLSASNTADPTILLHTLRELFGAVLLGICLGLPMAWFSGWVRRGEPTLLEALGMVVTCAGLALLWELPYLLCCVILGVVVTNFARHHKRPFHAIEEIEWPFLALFFIFTGAYLAASDVLRAGWLLAAYLCLRVLGRMCGGLLAEGSSSIEPGVGLRMGMAMLPQAGVALAMTIYAVGIYPELKGSLLPVVAAATVLFELVGPIIARRMIHLADKAEQARSVTDL